MTELEKLMQSLDPSLLQKINNFAQSDEGTKLINSLSKDNKNDLLKKLSTMSEKDKSTLIKKAMQDPSLISKIKGMF